MKLKIDHWALTPHAASRMMERLISVKDLEEILHSPDVVMPQGPKYILAKGFSRRRDNMVAAVLLERKEHDLWLVITVMVNFAPRT